MDPPKPVAGWWGFKFDRFFPIDAVLGPIFSIDSRCLKTFDVNFFVLTSCRAWLSIAPWKKWAQLVKVDGQKSEPILASIINALKTQTFRAGFWLYKAKIRNSYLWRRSRQYQVFRGAKKLKFQKSVFV